jgi:cytochrome c oxidase assembly protein subunit 11
MNLRNRNLGVVAGLVVILCIMTTAVSYSVTLYRLFCSATGFGGETRRVAADDATLGNRVITIRFNADVAPGMPWRVAPLQREVKVRLGEEKLVLFSAENLSDQPVVGHATYNVTPTKSGSYFNKIQCFCFNEERLGPHESVQMPVDFFVDPDLAKDPNATDIDTITLSYSFFPSVRPDDAKDLSRFDKPGAIAAEQDPTPERGQALFASRCAACHSLTVNKVGPKLDGVFGRRAGSVAGFAYSEAVRDADIVWTAANLDRWLANPDKFIPGALMPLVTPDRNDRASLIAYLKEQGSVAVAQSPPK